LLRGRRETMRLEAPLRVGPLTGRQYEVLQAVADGRVLRGLLLGTLEPHLLGGQDIIWTLRALVVRRLILLQPLGAPRVTARGLDMLNGSE
jgi:hypothetical protein